MPPRRLEPRAYAVFAAGLVLFAAAAFYVPALRATSGAWPAPLDDVFIHFGFARSAALGHPFEWIPGNGYSSGDTSLLYPFVLAVGWLVGFRGTSLGLFAALVACASLLFVARSLRRIVEPAPTLFAWLSAPLLVAIGLLDWSLFSGMEVALFAAALAALVVAAIDASEADLDARPARQLRVGVLGLAAVAIRPEAVAVVAPLSVVVAYTGCSTPPLTSLVRAGGPAAALVMASAVLFRALTGEWSAAGAVLKLLPYNPHLSGLDVAREMTINLVVLRAKAFVSALSAVPYGSLALPVLAAGALVDRKKRPLGVGLLAAIVGFTLLVSVNATARFQNLRYVAPALTLLVLAAVHGAGALASRATLRPVAALLLAVAIVAPLPRLPAQIEHFRASSANIHEQQVAVAERLASRSPRPRRVFVGDAGAIPYVSGLDALDGLGLGGFRRLPFARAAVQGVPAVVELVERLDARDRPDVLAVYPGWWKGLVEPFGEREGSVKIEHNVICAADEKVIYRADWSALAPAGEARDDEIDALDVGDVVSESEHRYALPSPRAGWITYAILPERAGAERRFDAGRIVPAGAVERFVVGAGVRAGAATLVLRTDPGDPIALEVDVRRDGVVRASAMLDLPRRAEGVWHEVSAELADVAGGDEIALRPSGGAFRDYHAWLLRP